MARRFKKQKAGQQQRKQRKKPAGTASSSAAGGTMSGMRGGLKSFFGSSAKGKKPTAGSRVLDVALWIAVGVAAVYFFSNRCT